MNFLSLLKAGQVIVWDGGLGTTLTGKFDPSKYGPLEELNLKNPDLVLTAHKEFLESGAQVIETNTFGANRIVLAEYGLGDKVREINLKAVGIAKNAIAPSRGGGEGGGVHSRFISASIGPTSKLPTLGHISFDELVAAYKEQIDILAKAGVDILQIETCQDILQAKTAVIACHESLRSAKGGEAIPLRKVDPGDCFAHARNDTIPIIVTFTIEKNGTTLLGTEIGAALAALEPLGIAAFGLNCATGPAEMEEHVRYLADYSRLPIAVLPNAGLPKIKNGIATYPLSPKEFGDWLEYFVKKIGVQIVGGCCGTTPAHIAELSKRLRGYKIRPKKKKSLHFLSSLYSPVAINQDPKPLIIGERMNINGSKEFKEYILAEKYDEAAQMAKRQAENGAHILDLSVAYAGRDELKDIDEISKRLSKSSPIPIMIDSTNPEAIEVALKNLGGRSVINSINLEDGGAKAEKILGIAKKYGAAVVGLTIDEDGMALTVPKKIKIAKRLVRLCAKYDVTLLVDFLTFTLLEPRAAEFGSGAKTLEALKKLNVYTVLGISNISYGVKKEARQILNSVFLHDAVKHGLDAAIVHAGQITPLHKIDKKAASLAKNLIWCKNKNALQDFVSFFEKSPSLSSEKGPIKKLDDKELIRKAIIDGASDLLEEPIERMVTKTGATEIINKIMLPAMQEVGEMFGDGELPLPFVLQSAEVMRKGLDRLSHHMDKTNAPNKGTLLLATVRGDVHDIGKNLVDIILSNNGFRVINLGVKQPVSEIIAAVEKFKPDAIGLSGLLVQSCIIMREDLEELSHRKIEIPVICGGAALTRKFVDSDLKKVYGKNVYYAKDAFDGLRIMNEVCK